MYNYFSQYRKIVKKEDNPYDSIKPDINGSNDKEKTTEPVSNGTQSESVEIDPPESIPAPEPSADVKITNSYHGSSDDDDIAAFEKSIGSNIIRNAVNVPPPDDVVVEERPVEKKEESVAATETSGSVQKYVKPYVPPKSDDVVKIRYDDEEKQNGIKFSNLKKVPVDLATLVQQYFPNAANKSDAVAAYIYVKEGCPADVKVPEGIKELAETYQGESATISDLEKIISGSVQDLRRYVQKQLHDLAERLYTVEMLTSYSLFDQLDFRQKDAPTPSDIDFYESGLADLIKHSEKEAGKQRKKAEYDNNRPY